MLTQMHTNTAHYGQGLLSSRSRVKEAHRPATSVSCHRRHAHPSLALLDSYPEEEERQKGKAGGRRSGKEEAGWAGHCCRQQDHGGELAARSMEAIPPYPCSMTLSAQAACVAFGLWLTPGTWWSFLSLPC